jgi:hypothetical protein
MCDVISEEHDVIVAQEDEGVLTKEAKIKRTHGKKVKTPTSKGILLLKRGVRQPRTQPNSPLSNNRINQTPAAIS